MRVCARRKAPSPRGCRVLAALLALCAGSAAAAPPGEAAFSAVDPFIGTGGEGHTFPGAVVPFGMIQLSPDTQIRPRNEGYGWAAGYRYDDHTIVGFSHTHFSGTGHSDLGDVLRDADRRRRAARARRRRTSPAAATPRASATTDEVAQPGYYAVTLERLRRARRADRGRARRRASLHLPAGQPGARAARPAHQPLRLPGQGAVVAPAAARATAPSPAFARRAAGRRAGSCTSRCASRGR